MPGKYFVFGADKIKMKPKMPGLPSCSSTFAIPCSSGNGQNTKNGGENLVQEEQKQSRNRWKENGFEEWGGYMEAKKAKLDVQINLEGSLKNGNLAEGSDGFGIFNGISIYINGHTSMLFLSICERHVFNFYIVFVDFSPP